MGGGGGGGGGVMGWRLGLYETSTYWDNYMADSERNGVTTSNRWPPFSHHGVLRPTEMQH